MFAVLHVQLKLWYMYVVCLVVPSHLMSQGCHTPQLQLSFSQRCGITRTLDHLRIGIHVQQKLSSTSHTLCYMVVALLLTKLRLGVHACRVMQQNQECIPNVLALFLGDTGIGHPDEVCSIFLQSACPMLREGSCKIL